MVTLSSKVNKLVKRTVMDSALVGEILDSMGRCYEVFGQEMSYNTAHIPACVSLTLIAAAGAAKLVGQFAAADRPAFFAPTGTD